MYVKLFRNMVWTIFVALLLAAGLSITSNATHAQKRVFPVGCAPHATIAKALQNKHKEVPNAYGIMGSNFIIEVYVSNEGNWTVVRTDRAGTACIVATGHSWETLNVVRGEGV